MREPLVHIYLAMQLALGLAAALVYVLATHDAG
jgi:hypothetical protein